MVMESLMVRETPMFHDGNLVCLMFSRSLQVSNLQQVRTGSEADTWRQACVQLFIMMDLDIHLHINRAMTILK